MLLIIVLSMGFRCELVLVIYLKGLLLNWLWLVGVVLNVCLVRLVDCVVLVLVCSSDLISSVSYWLGWLNIIGVWWLLNMVVCSSL